MAIFPRIRSSLSNINSIVLHLQTNLFEEIWEIWEIWEIQMFEQANKEGLKVIFWKVDVEYVLFYLRFCLMKWIRSLMYGEFTCWN